MHVSTQDAVDSIKAHLHKTSLPHPRSYCTQGSRTINLRQIHLGKVRNHRPWIQALKLKGQSYSGSRSTTKRKGFRKNTNLPSSGEWMCFCCISIYVSDLKHACIHACMTCMCASVLIRVCACVCVCICCKLTTNKSNQRLKFNLVSSEMHGTPTKKHLCVDTVSLSQQQFLKELCKSPF